MEDTVRAHYHCYNCDEDYCEFNTYEGELADCPNCKTPNYPGYEVISIRFLKKMQRKRFQRVFHEIF